MAYVAREGKQEFAVVDGHEGPMYDAVRQITFSNDGHRVAYVGWKVKTQVVVVDGKEGPEYPAVGPLEFSPDGRHFYYSAFQSRDTSQIGDKDITEIIDGQPQPARGKFRIGPIFSSDMQHNAYVPFGKMREERVFLDGQEGPAYTEIAKGPVFQPNGSLEYLAIRDHVLYRVTQPLPIAGVK